MGRTTRSTRVQSNYQMGTRSHPVGPRRLYRASSIIDYDQPDVNVELQLRAHVDQAVEARRPDPDLGYARRWFETPWGRGLAEWQRADARRHKVERIQIRRRQRADPDRYDAFKAQNAMLARARVCRYRFGIHRRKNTDNMGEENHEEEEVGEACLYFTDHERVGFQPWYPTRPVYSYDEAVCRNWILEDWDDAQEIFEDLVVRPVSSGWRYSDNDYDVVDDWEI
jgi:hypothetical protein